MTVRPFVSLVVALLARPASAADVPSQLPDPDGKLGDATKRLRVYILAGQSNMAGMGEFSDVCESCSGGDSG